MGPARGDGPPGARVAARATGHRRGIVGLAAVGFEFDEATAVEPVGDAAFRGHVSDRWSVAGAPNGGYLVSIGLNALRRVLSHPDPFAVSAHFVARAEEGPVDVAVEVVRAGRGLSTGVARLAQGGRMRVHLTATFGDLGALDGPTVVTGELPAIPPVEDCVAATGPAAFAFTRRFDIRLTPASAAWAVDRPSGVAEVAGWIRFADGRPVDAASLPQFADAFPPTAFNLFEGVGWVPTIELSVHVRGRPSDGWLRCRFRTRFLIDGYLEEDGELWDDTGRLVALSRQMARLRL